MVLAPDVAGEQVGQRRDRAPPRDVAAGVEPLGVLVEHRVDEVDERLVAVEQPVPPGEQVALQPALAQVLRQHLGDAADLGDALVDRRRLAEELPVRGLEHRLQAVRRGLVRGHHPEVVRVHPDHVAQPRAEHRGGADRARAGLGDVDGVVREVGQPQVAQQLAAVGVRGGAHPLRALGGERAQRRDQPALAVEQLVRPVRPQPLLQLGAVGVVVAGLRQRHLMGAPRALDELAVHLVRPGPALRGAQDEHRPAGPVDAPLGVELLLGVGADAGDLGDDLVQRGGHPLVDGHGVLAVEPALDDVRAVAVPFELPEQLVLRDPGQDRRVGDLVAVEVQDRQHGAVVDRVQELVRLPRARQRPRLGLAVADHAGHEQVRVVERGTVGVRERVTELAALVDGARGLRRGVAGDAAGERELAEQRLQTFGVVGDVGVPLGVGALEVRRRHDARAPVSRPGDVESVEVVADDDAVQVRPEEGQTGGGAPVPEQPGLDVRGDERFPQERVVHQVDLPDGQVVRGPPPGVERPQVGPGRRCGPAGGGGGHVSTGPSTGPAAPGPRVTGSGTTG